MQTWKAADRPRRTECGIERLTVGFERSSSRRYGFRAHGNTGTRPRTRSEPDRYRDSQIADTRRPRTRDAEVGGVHAILGRIAFLRALGARAPGTRQMPSVSRRPPWCARSPPECRSLAVSHDEFLRHRSPIRKRTFSWPRLRSRKDRSANSFSCASKVCAIDDGGESAGRLLAAEPPRRRNRGEEDGCI